MLSEALTCAVEWSRFAGSGWHWQPVEPLAQVTDRLLPFLRTRIEIATTPGHAQSFHEQAGGHLTRLRDWESTHPIAESKLDNGSSEFRRRGYRSRTNVETLSVGTAVTGRFSDAVPEVMWNAATGLATLIGGWVDQLAAGEERAALGLGLVPTDISAMNETLARLEAKVSAISAPAKDSVRAQRPEGRSVPVPLKVVLWESAAPTERNIRLARTRTAYLEAHGNVREAMKALRGESVGVARSTFYNHLAALDDECPGWRASVLLSRPAGLLEEHGMSRRRRKTRGKPG